MQWRSLVRTILIVAIVPLFVVLIGGFFSPIHPAADSMAHFRLHAALGLAVIAVCLALLRFWKTAVALLLLVAAGVAGAYPSLPGLPPRLEGPPDLRLAQLNTFFKNPKPQATAQWIKDESPDVVFLQEVSPKTQQIPNSLIGSYPYQIVCRYGVVGDVAVLSRFPAVASKCIEEEGLVWMQVQIGERKLTFASLHLHWPYPYRQWKQVERISKELEAMPRPVVLAGDFNAAPWSSAVRRIESLSGAKAIPGLRLTLRMSFGGMAPVQMLPIDHMLLPPELEALFIRLGPPVGSDHLPTIAGVAYAEKQHQ